MAASSTPPPTLTGVRILRLHRKPIRLDDYRLRSAQESDYDLFLDEPTIIVDADSGETVIVYLELDLDSTDLIAALHKIEYNEDFRTDGLPNRTAVVGYLPRNTIRRDFCTASKLAYEQPAEHAVVCSYAAAVARYYANLNPALYAAHQDTMAAHVVRDYQIPASPFTSGIINKNNPLKYHFDGGNFKDVWSCMLVFKHAIRGGHLACPEYGLGFKLRHNSLFMFDGQRILHGVTPIIKLMENSWRYSIVFYSMQQMWNCDPLGTEVTRIRSLKTTREQRRAHLMETLRVDMHAPVEYPIYVLSKGRPHRAQALNVLRGAHLPYTVVVEPSEFSAYSHDYPHASFLCLPADNLGLARVRQWLLEYCAQVGYAYYWQLDDTLEFRYLHEGQEQPVTPNVVLNGIERLAAAHPDASLLGAASGKVGSGPDVLREAIPRLCVLVNPRVRTLFATPPIAYDPTFTLHEDTAFALQIQEAGGHTLVSTRYRCYKPRIGKTTVGGLCPVWHAGQNRPMQEQLAARWPTRVRLVPVKGLGIGVQIVPRDPAALTIGDTVAGAAADALSAATDASEAAYHAAEDAEIARAVAAAVPL